jgi:hypothetical protein
MQNTEYRDKTRLGKVILNSIFFPKKEAFLVKRPLSESKSSS